MSGFTAISFMSQFYDAPLPSSHSKESGQSRWLVLTISPLFCGLFPIISTYTKLLFVCLTYMLFRPIRHCSLIIINATYLLGINLCWNRGNWIIPPFASGPVKTVRHGWPKFSLPQHGEPKWTKSNPDDVARGVYETKREPAWDHRVDELHQSTREFLLRCNVI